MDASSSAAPQCYYESGRYKGALLMFERQICQQDMTLPLKAEDYKTASNEEEVEWMITVDGPPSIRTVLTPRIELSALSLSARRADAALCRFRSAIHSCENDVVFTDKEETTNLISTWEQAIQANYDYRESLEGAASSLINTCFVEMNFIQQIKHQSPATYDEIRHQRREENSRVQNAIKSTAVSILMAAIASTHLYLYEAHLQHHNSTVWNILVCSAKLAADLLCLHNKFRDCLLGEEIKEHNNNEKGTLQSWMKVLNETLDDKRSGVALHSFRIAIKVAALACGKLVLPNIELDPDNVVFPEVPLRKCHKNQPNQQSNVTSKSKTNAWNTTYVHNNGTLHSRERLVDAISCHSALMHCRTKTKHSNSDLGSDTQRINREIYLKRKTCFIDAMKWESRMKALHINETSSIPQDVASGYTSKIYNCVRGLEFVDKDMQILDLNQSNEDRKNVFEALERLATTSTSKFASDILGSIYVHNGDYSKAVEMFQLSIEREGITNRHHPDIDADVESNHEFVERRAVSNIASCFVAMGCTAEPLQMLLEIWPPSDEREVNHANILEPKALLFSNKLSEMENTSTANAGIASVNRIKLLWMIFYVSSLANDWATCLHATELMTEHCDSKDTDSFVRIAVTNIFALLQCQRVNHVEAQDLIQKLDIFTTYHPKQIILTILVELYIADISLLVDQTLESSGSNSLCQHTSRAMTLFKTCTSKLDATISSSLLELKVLLLNNRGIGCVTEGDSAGALKYFCEASALCSLARSNNAEQQFHLLMPVYFNLSLLLLRDGKVNESAKAWLSVRGHLNTWDSARKGESNALSKLRDEYLVAMNRHGTALARWSMTNASFNETNVTKWVTPVIGKEKWEEESMCINGVESTQICTLDLVLLKYALSSAEKKSNALLRHHAGLFGS